MRLMAPPALLLAAVVLAAPSCAQEAEKRPLSLDDWGAVKTPYLPRFSPDGEQLLYHLDRQLFLATDDPTAPRQLTSDNEGGWGARWSADGESIFYLSDYGDGVQLYRMTVDDEGDPEQITQFKNGLSSSNLSPDESRLLFRVSDDSLRGKSENPEPIVVTRRHFKRDAGHGYITDGTLNHLHVYDIETGEVQRLTSGNFEDGNGSWSPDSKRITFASNRQEVPDSDYRADIFVIDLEADEPRLRRLTDDARTKQYPAFSPDGESIAYLSAEDGVYAVNRIAVISQDGGDPRFLTSDFDRTIWSFKWSPDGEWIYFQYDNRGATPLARVNAKSGHIETVISDEQVTGSFDASSTGAIAFVSYKGVTGPELYRYHNERTVALTDVNGDFFDAVALGEMYKTTVKSTDDISIDTFITLPTNYEPGRSYPTILDIHGGPVGQFGWGFSFSTQFYANNGYVVIQPNPRGSSGRGQAFIRAIYRSWGEPDYDDVMAAVDYAVDEGIADPKRLVVTGYSYGGYMTNVVITETQRFVAAASGAGHSNSTANVGHDMYSQWYFWELGTPWENRDRYDVHSPYWRVGNVTTPTLFYGGRVDWNVPILSAELMYQALQVRGIESQLVVYPETHHGGWSAEFEKDALTRVLNWFNRHTE